MNKITGIILSMVFAISVFSQTASITIIATTDGHGYITSYDYLNEKEVDYGLPYLAYLIKNLREEKKNIILVDCGDTISGAPITYYHAYYKSDKPNPVIKVMNLLNYDIAVIGNHDFDFGTGYLTKAINQSNFTWISANVYNNNSPFTYEYKIVEKQGVKIGFFGLTTPATYYLEPPQNIKGLTFKQMTECAKRTVSKLKKEGADIVVALVHSGKGPMYEAKEPFENALYYILENVKGIDIAIYGHTHRENPIEIYNNVLICQPKNYYHSLGIVMVDLQKRDGHWELLNKTSTVIQPTGRKLKSVEKSVKDITSDLEDFLNEKIGKYKQPIEFFEDYNKPGSGFDLIIEMEKEAMPDADCYLYTLPYEGSVKEKGDKLRIKHVFKLLPYDNYLVKCKIKGKNLKKLLEKGASLFDSSGKLKSGEKPFFCDIARNIDYTVDFSKPEGNRITIKSINKKGFNPEEDYTVVLTTYRYAENHDLFEKNGKSYSKTSLRTFAIEYLKEKYGNKKGSEKSGFFNW